VLVGHYVAVREVFYTYPVNQDLYEYQAAYGADGFLGVIYEVLPVPAVVTLQDFVDDVYEYMDSGAVNGVVHVVQWPSPLEGQYAWYGAPLPVQSLAVLEGDGVTVTVDISEPDTVFLVTCHALQLGGNALALVNRNNWTNYGNAETMALCICNAVLSNLTFPGPVSGLRNFNQWGQFRYSAQGVAA
jgi:hypothetical protein